MTEPDARAVGHEDAPRHPLVDRVLDGRGVRAAAGRHVGEVREARGPSADGQHLGEPPRRRRHPVPGAQQGLAERIGQPVGQTVGVGRQARDQHLGEVRVAVRLLADLPQQSCLHRATEELLQLLLGLLGAQPDERERGHRRHPAHVREPAPEGVARTELLVAVGGDDGERLTTEPSTQVSDRVPGRRGAPLDVVDDQHGRSEGDDPGEDLVDDRHQPHRGRRPRAAERGQEQGGARYAGEHLLTHLGGGLLRPALDRQDQREVRRLDRTEPQAPSPQHRDAAGSSLVDDGEHQAGLADAGLAVDEDGARAPCRRPVDPLAEQPLLLVATDDARRRDRARVAHPSSVCPSAGRLVARIGRPSGSEGYPHRI